MKKINKEMEVKCVYCGKKPEEIQEYIDSAKNLAESLEVEVTPTEYVKSEEGTYNPAFGLFYCTSCYIKYGMPLGVAQPHRSPLMSNSEQLRSTDELVKDLVEEFAEAGLKISNLKGVDIDGDKY